MAPLAQQKKSLHAYLFNAGVDESYSSIESKRIIITNYTLAIAVFCCIVYSTVFLFFNISPLRNIFLISTVYYIAVWSLNLKGFTRVAKTAVYLGLLIQVSFMCVALGPQGNASNFYIPIAIIPFIIFGPKERVLLYLALTATLANILFINFSNPKIYHPEIPDLRNVYYLINYSIDIACIGCMIALAFLFLTLTEYGEKMLTIKNTELEESREEQRRLNGLKDRLLSIISHDVKHPINNLQSITDLILEGKLSKSETEYVLKNLKNSASTTSQLLDNLLNWSAGQLNTLTPSFQPISIKIVIEKVLTHVEYKSIPKNINITLHLSPDHFVMADEQMLEIILRNLIINAIKFSKPGQQIQVRTSKNSHMLHIDVIDQGIGIPDDIHEKLFSTDYSKSRYGTINEKGFGLGLLLCKQLTELHQGTISAESIPNEKTTFRVALPVA
jgi:two-component system sensor histidine kinase/response regulator